jgi:hypothetical protein
MLTPPPTYTQYPRFNNPEIRFDAIGEAFQIFARNWKVYIPASIPSLVALIIYFAISFGASFMSGLSGSNDLAQLGPALALQYGSMFLMYFVIAWQIAGIIRMAVRDLNGETIQVSDAYKFDGKVGAVIGAAISIGILTTLGYIACCVPGFLASGAFMLTYPLILEQRLGVFEAMGKSWETLKPHIWKAAGYFFLTTLILSVSQSFCIGVVVGLPVLCICLAIVYKDFFLSQPMTDSFGQVIEN